SWGGHTDRADADYLVARYSEEGRTYSSNLVTIRYQDPQAGTLTGPRTDYDTDGKVIGTAQVSIAVSVINYPLDIPHQHGTLGFYVITNTLSGTFLGSDVVRSKPEDVSGRFLTSVSDLVRSAPIPGFAGSFPHYLSLTFSAFDNTTGFGT